MNTPKEILARMNISASSIKAFKSIEDGSEYEAWRVSDESGEYVLKKAKGEEIAIYSAFFSEPVSGAPHFFSALNTEDGAYFLMEYCAGKDLCKCTRDSLVKTIDALISLQEKYWNTEPIFYEKALE